MTSQAKTLPDHSAPYPSMWSLPNCCGILTAAVLLCLLFVGTWRYQQFGMAGVWGATLAAGICWAGAIVALICTVRFRGDNAMVALGASMLFRTFAPLAAVFAVSRFGGVLADVGTVGSLLIFFPVTLLLEVTLVYFVLRTTHGPQPSRS